MVVVPPELPAELNQTMPAATALFTTVSSGPVPLPGPSYAAPSEREMMVTPLTANQSTAACRSAVVDTVARYRLACGAMSWIISATPSPWRSEPQIVQLAPALRQNVPAGVGSSRAVTAVSHALLLK